MSGWIGGNRYLTDAEMNQNAQYVDSFFLSKGWTINAVCGLLGNAQAESRVNPGEWESLVVNWDNGFGLLQWTPASGLKTWADSQGLDYTSMDTQLAKIIYEKEHGQQWGQTSSYPISFNDFTVSTQTPNYLAMAFLYNYERPADLNQPQRGTNADNWYTYLTGNPPTPGGGVFIPTGKMKLMYYLKRRI